MGTHYRGSEYEMEALDAFIKLTRAANAIFHRTRRSFTRDNLSDSQFAVLEVLLHRGALSQAEIAKKILKSGGNITLVVDNLEKRNLVQRNRNGKDRRVITVSLTASGRKLISKLFPTHVAEITREMSRLSQEEQRQLGQLCKKLGSENLAGEKKKSS